MGKVVDAQCRLSMENVKPYIKDFAKCGWLPWQQEINVDANGGKGMPCNGIKKDQSEKSFIFFLTWMEKAKKKKVKCEVGQDH